MGLEDDAKRHVAQQQAEQRQREREAAPGRRKVTAAEVPHISELLDMLVRYRVPTRPLFTRTSTTRRIWFQQVHGHAYRRYADGWAISTWDGDVESRSWPRCALTRSGEIFNWDFQTVYDYDRQVSQEQLPKPVPRQTYAKVAVIDPERFWTVDSVQRELHFTTALARALVAGQLNSTSGHLVARVS